MELLIEPSFMLYDIIDCCVGDCCVMDCNFCGVDGDDSCGIDF